MGEIDSGITGPDPCGVLVQDIEVARVMAAAREEIDSVLWRRDVRTNAAAVARASIERGGRDSAAIDGADTAVVDDSPMGRALARAIDVTAAVPGQVGAWSKAPLQVIAALHGIAANGFATDDEMGRPRALGGPPALPTRWVGDCADRRPGNLGCRHRARRVTDPSALYLGFWLGRPRCCSMRACRAGG